MRIHEFAERHKVHISRDECGEIIIKGRKAKHCDADYPKLSFASESGIAQIYQHATSRFGVIFMPRRSSRLWNNARRRLLAAGFELHQDGDREGTLMFDPRDGKQATLALNTIGAKRKRQISESVRLRLAEQLRNARQNPCRTALHGPRIARNAPGEVIRPA